MSNTLIINVDQKTSRINRNIYGHFAEHLGRCIYDGIYVGSDSKIPNINGMRVDLIAALRHIKIPVLRWPGGCFADEYHWMDGIGPLENRPTMINTHWGGVTENNHFGTHEFLFLCEQLGCEPYICGNLGSGTVHEMQQWVEYITFDGISPMANLRRRNGRAEPWSVKYWGVGNENWGCGGSMRAEYYADEFRRYQTYLRNFGKNRLYKIACGPCGGDYHWTEVLMRNGTTNIFNQRVMDGLALHYYFGTGKKSRSATQFDEEDYFHLLKNTWVLQELVKRHSTIMDQFDPRKEIGLIVDEWGTWHEVEQGTNPGFLFQQNTMRDAMTAAIALNIFNHHSDRVQMANIAQTFNVLQAMALTDGERMLLTPTYHVFDLFKGHHDATLVTQTLETDSYAFNDAEIPALSASASMSDDGGLLITVCNANPGKAATLKCIIRGIEPCSQEILMKPEIKARILAAGEMTAHNTFDEPRQVVIQDFSAITANGPEWTIELPAMSIVAIEARKEE